MLEEGIYKYLLSNTALQEVLPSANAIYMGFVPASANYPCIMFQKVSSVNDTTQDGPSGYVVRRYQFTCLGKEDPNRPGSGYVSAQTVANVLRENLDGVTGTFPDGTVVRNIILDNELDLYDDEGETHNAIQDYFFHFDQQRTAQSA